MPSSYLPSTEELEPLITEINASYQQFLRGTSSSPSSDSSEEDDQGLREQAAALGKAARQLRALVADPDDWMIEACWSYLDVAALSSVIAMKIPSLIPVDGSATAETLAKETGGSPEVISTIRSLFLSSLYGHQSLIWLDRTSYAAMWPPFDFQGNRSRLLRA